MYTKCTLMATSFILSSLHSNHMIYSNLQETRLSFCFQMIPNQKLYPTQPVLNSSGQSVFFNIVRYAELLLNKSCILLIMTLLCYRLKVCLKLIYDTIITSWKQIYIHGHPVLVEENSELYLVHIPIH